MARASNQELNIFKGKILGKCHKVEAILGEGSFGVVAKCLNTETNQLEAVKVSKSCPGMIGQAKYEIDILKQLQRLDPDVCNIVNWDGFFFDKENICLTFELLDQSLNGYMEDRGYKPLPIAQIKDVLYQMATSLSRLKSVGIVHADIKADNVMVVDRTQQALKVKVIDFGLACRVADIMPGACMGTLWYIAPEMILQHPFNEAVDMWSLGMVAVEMATGCTLYPGDTPYDMLRYIIDTQGQPPDSVLDRAMGAEHYFERQWNSEQRWRFKTPEEFEFETGHQARDSRYVWLKHLDDLQELMVKGEGNQSDRHLLVDLIKRMLQLDPDRRITPQEALQHPFFAHSAPPQSSPGENFIITDETAEQQQSAEVSEQPSSNQMEKPKTIGCRDKKTHHSLAVGEQERINEIEAQPETNAENTGWFQNVMKRIADTFQSYFHLNR